MSKEAKEASSSSSSSRDVAFADTCDSHRSMIELDEHGHPDDSNDDLIHSLLNKLSADKFLWLVSLFAAMGGLLFGYDIGIISGVLLFLRKDFHLTSLLEEILVSIVLVGGVIGHFLVLLAGYLSDVKGRKVTIASAAVFFALGAMIMAACPSGLLILLMFGRFVVGLGIGLSSMTIPLYIAEIAPAEHRGKLVAADELFIVSGIFLSFLVNWAVTVLDVHQPWRWSFGISLFFALLQIFGLYFLPESPRWLMAQNRTDEARQVLRRVRTSDSQVHDEMSAIRSALEEFSFGIHWLTSIPQLIHPSNRRALLMSLTLALFVQFTGQPTVLYYSSKVIDSTKAFSSIAVVFAVSALPMLIKLIATAVATFGLVDQYGRRKPLIFGLLAMAVFLTLLSITFFFQSKNSFVTGILVVVLISGYVAAFAIGLGPVCFVMFSEIFPAHLRAVGQSISIAAMLFFNLIVSLSFLSLADALGVGVVFLVYGVISLFGVAFVYFLLPETNGTGLEESAQLFQLKSFESE